MTINLAPEVAKAVFPAVTTVVNDETSLTLPSNSAETIILAKIPSKSRITRFYYELTTAATSAPSDLGTDESTAAASAFASAVAKATGTQVTSDIPYRVLLTDTASPQHILVQATVTATSAVTDARVRYVIDYLMD